MTLVRGLRSPARPQGQELMASRLSPVQQDLGQPLHVPPYNPEAEESILGAGLLSRETVANVQGTGWLDVLG
jgi:hypothetical protein